MVSSASSVRITSALVFNSSYHIFYLHTYLILIYCAQHLWSYDLTALYKSIIILLILIFLKISFNYNYHFFKLPLIVYIPGLKSRVTNNVGWSGTSPILWGPEIYKWKSPNCIAGPPETGWKRYMVSRESPVTLVIIISISSVQFSNCASCKSHNQPAHFLPFISPVIFVCRSVCLSVSIDRHTILSNSAGSKLP